MKVELFQLPLSAAISMLADFFEDVASIFEETAGLQTKQCKQKSKAAKSVPTSDRIKIPNRIVDDCKKAVKAKEKEKNMTMKKKKKAPAKKKSCPDCKPAKMTAKKAAAKKVAAKKPAPAPLFTADEQRKILSLRKKGLTIKEIGKAIKRRDKSVSAFLKSVAAKKAK